MEKQKKFQTSSAPIQKGIDDFKIISCKTKFISSARSLTKRFQEDQFEKHKSYI